VEEACLFFWVRVLMCMFVISAVLYMFTRFAWCLVDCEISRGARKLARTPT
jgi:predicted metal-dependent hydrolase